MTGEQLTIGTAKGTTQANYLEQRKFVTKPLTQEQKETFTDLLKRYYPDEVSDGYTTVKDKNGNLRTGKVVTTQQVSLQDIIQNLKSGKPFAINEPLPTVKAEQVNRFIDSIKSLGLDIKAEDVMTKAGTLNPNFKVDDKGNISFRNLKSYINGNAPEYFETEDGKWAQGYPAMPLIKDGTLIKADNNGEKKDPGSVIPADKDNDKDKVKDNTGIADWLRQKLQEVGNGNFILPAFKRPKAPEPQLLGDTQKRNIEFIPTIRSVETDNKLQTGESRVYKL